MDLTNPPTRKGYLFTAGVTLSQTLPSGSRSGKSLQTWDTCMSAIVYGGDAAGAQQTFEDWCQTQREGEDPVQTEIKKIIGAELVEQLLTESGGTPIDWPGICRRLLESPSIAETSPEAEAQTQDLGEGYWVDVTRQCLRKRPGWIWNRSNANCRRISVRR